nr:hypothetical protein [Tanacetum cinerariifolium]
MTSLADKAILSGADNRPPMLENDMYDSWKSIMELYMLNRQHGQMILESVENGPLLWQTVEDNGVTRSKKFSELSTTEAIQADCDVKATNIILQGLPPEVYALVSTHKVAKELWEIIQMLMQGTSLTKQKRECKLYDEFDKFAYRKGESLREFYLRFSLLLNNMNIYNMKLEQFEVNTKFLNTLPPEWSKFVTDVKLVRDLHTTNVDQLHAYLGQHEYHANEYGTPYHSSQYASQAQSSTPLLITYPSNDFQSSVNHNVYNPSSSIPQMKYAPAIHQQSDFSQPESGLVVLVFQKGKQKVIVCYNCKGEGHMSKQCIKPKRKRDEAWFKDKIALMANLSHYRSDNLVVVHNQDNMTNNVIYQDVQATSTSEQLNILNPSKTEITSDSNIISYSQAQQLEPKLYDGSVIQKTDAIVILDSEETLMLEDESRSKMLQKQKDPMMSEKKTELSAEQAFWSWNSVNSEEPNLSTSTTI